MSVWTLTYGDVTKTFEAWGLKALQRTQVSQAVGNVTFTQSGAAYDGTPLFAIDAVVTISKDGTPWHVGPVVKVPRMGGAKAEQLDYEIADPWWYLEQLTYEQPIVTGSGDTNTTRISLFGSVVGGVTVKLSVQEAITNAIGLAVAAGASMQVAFSGSFGVSPPMADMRDPTCAEIIRAALRWVPDATLGWKYDTNPPTLCVATRAGATARTIDLADKVSVNLIDITARDDLRRDRVMIYYEITSTDGEETYTELVLDNAGSGSPFRTLKATLPLSGPQTQRQSQYIETEAISSESTTWWQRHVPMLAESSELEITDGSIAPAEDGTGDFSRAIVDGQVPGWLDDPETPISGNMRVSAKASYKISKDDGSEVQYKDDPASVVISCTDLTTGVYSHVTSYTDGEPIPSGVAAALLAAVGVLQYDGKLKIKQRECVFIARPGDVLNLANGQTAWATAKMQVQKVDEEIDAGATTITFGPPKHLSPQDIIEMLRTLRGKPPVYNLQERATGKKGDGNKTQGGSGTANDNGNSAAAAWHRVVSKSPDGTKTMTLDAAAGLKLEEADGSFIDHQTANNRTLYQDASGNSCEVKPTQVSLLDESGNGAVLSASGLVITSDGESTSLTWGQLFMMVGGVSSTLTPAHLLLDEGGGITNSITGEQMVISGSGQTGIYGSDSVAYSSGANSATLSSSSLSITNGGYTATMSGEGGFSDTDGTSLARMNSSVGGYFDSGSGTVTIYPVEGKDISLLDVDACKTVDGVPSSETITVLRSPDT